MTAADHRRALDRLSGAMRRLRTNPEAPADEQPDDGASDVVAVAPAPPPALQPPAPPEGQATR